MHQVATSYRSRFLQLLQLPAAVALIICIVGGSDLTDSSVSKQSTGKNLIKAGLIIFLIIYICLFLLKVKISVSESSSIPSGEKPVIYALRVALPLLGVRILYSLLAYFSTISVFSPLNGNIFVRAFMSTLEEILVVIAYAVAGIMVSQYDNARMRDPEMEIRYPKTRVNEPARYAPQ